MQDQDLDEWRRVWYGWWASRVNGHHGPVDDAELPVAVSCETKRPQVKSWKTVVALIGWRPLVGCAGLLRKRPTVDSIRASIGFVEEAS